MEYCLIDLISFIDVSSILADLVEIDTDSDSSFVTSDSDSILTYLLTLFVQNPLSTFLRHSFIIQSSFDSFPSTQTKLVELSCSNLLCDRC